VLNRMLTNLPAVLKTTKLLLLFQASGVGVIGATRGRFEIPGSKS